MRVLPQESGYTPFPFLRSNADVLPKIELRAEAIRRDILVTLIDLFEFDKQGLSGGPRGLVLLAEFGSYLKLLKKTLLTMLLRGYTRRARTGSAHQKTSCVFER